MYSLEVMKPSFNAYYMTAGVWFRSDDYADGLKTTFPTPQEFIRNRFMRLAVARCLQARRSCSIESMIGDIGYMSRSATSSFAGLMSKYKQAGAVAGVVAGKDERGYPFRNWILQDAAAAKGLLSEQHISPMPIEGLSAMGKRRDVDTGQLTARG